MAFELRHRYCRVCQKVKCFTLISNRSPPKKAWSGLKRIKNVTLAWYLSDSGFKHHEVISEAGLKLVGIDIPEKIRNGTITIKCSNIMPHLWKTN